MARHYIRHYYLNDSVYFLTVHAIKRRCLLDSDEKKHSLFQSICEVLRKNKYRLFAWAIFDDHYHILFRTRIGSLFPTIVKDIHDDCARKFKDLESKKRANKLFHNYWDCFIRTQDDFFHYFNFIHTNAIRHGYAKNNRDYIFSSYRFWEWRRNRFWLHQLQKEFPPNELNLKEDQGLHQARMKEKLQI